MVERSPKIFSSKEKVTTMLWWAGPLSRSALKIYTAVCELFCGSHTHKLLTHGSRWSAVCHTLWKCLHTKMADDSFVEEYAAKVWPVSVVWLLDVLARTSFVRMFFCCYVASYFSSLSCGFGGFFWSRRGGLFHNLKVLIPDYVCVCLCVFMHVYVHTFTSLW